VHSYVQAAQTLQGVFITGLANRISCLIRGILVPSVRQAGTLSLIPRAMEFAFLQVEMMGSRITDIRSGEGQKYASDLEMESWKWKV
jgi:hypothetical protein